jgi:predicted nucleic acid-binding protein
VVVDASVLAEMLIGSPLGEVARQRLAGDAVVLHVPQVAALEVIAVLRKWEVAGALDGAAAARAAADLAHWPVREWPLDGLLGRVWELRHNLGPYDAAYAALAEALGAPVFTADLKLARAIETFARCDAETADLGRGHSAEPT